MKRIISTSLVLLLILGGISAAFAAEKPADNTASPSAVTSEAVAAADTATPAAVEGDTSTTPAVTVIPDMNFTGQEVKLSLEAAYKKMLADSPGAKLAELNRQSADGVAKGYGESVQTLKQMEKSGSWAYDSSNKEMAKANREYATAQGPKNYEAEINDLKTNTLKNYYTLKELENQAKIAKDNLALKEKLLTNTQLKFKLGTVSKNDVLQAEISVNEAKDQLLAAENGLKTMKMAFNQFMGYNLMQNVTLTDIIKEVPLSSKSLADSIKGALASRNEISEAAYGLQVANLAFKNYTAYPKNSSKYIKAQMDVLKAETGYKNAPLTVESDVRNKYMEMNQKYAAVQTGKKTVENAKETERLAQLQYDAGMATLSDVETAQLGYYNAQLTYSKTLLEYNLAVNDYELSSGVGTTPALIP
ncbi:TolC family protein [Sinanaerobacter chloroacetimidivorans]|uniref:TolC family protein n=1 Tax=Sinanaerobacter chloroacetimidivorans TaxID=2818044 RepID=A0A8J7W5N9_9FIRM|nr:TolC family protein [Sinanaerobacter chloroacetimidivorans]MBR0599553.1 TolC family protein [Sinanaerobacter chloroacetimidivorans]